MLQKVVLRPDSALVVCCGLLAKCLRVWVRIRVRVRVRVRAGARYLVCKCGKHLDLCSLARYYYYY